MLKWLAKLVLTKEINQWHDDINRFQRQCATLMGERETLRSSLNAMTKHRDQLAEYLSNIGKADSWAVRQELDKIKHEKGENLQLFCPDCMVGVGDTKDFDAGIPMQTCGECPHKEFARSWEIEL